MSYHPSVHYHQQLLNQCLNEGLSLHGLAQDLGVVACNDEATTSGLYRRTKRMGPKRRPAPAPAPAPSTAGRTVKAASSRPVLSIERRRPKPEQLAALLARFK